jgi:glycosyltransferase involved in cell wall biosynthesis
VLINILLTLSTSAIGLLLIRTVLSLHRYKYRAVANTVTSLPTVSVCIAARNETHALAQCLERVLKSDYPKLEILVLDDSSDDDTSLIIKSFAQAGVRFIAGDELPQKNWLGKNHAYYTLTAEASGEYILFLDVDTTLRVSTVSQLMAHLLDSNKAMLSVLPRREDSYRWSAITGTLRYYWELLLANKHNPPASSALWIVSSSELKVTGNGLENYGLSVRPERHLARQLYRQQQYSYIIGTSKLGVGYEKRLHSQYETALRLYYPMTGRGSIQWLLAVLYLSLLLLPLPIIFFALSDAAVSLWAFILVVLVAVSFGLFTLDTYGRVAWQLRVVLGPFLVLQELILITLSYSKYRSGRVTWKGRAVSAQPNRHDAFSLDE